MQRRLGTLERPGARIHYEVAGAGPAIVFAHGLGGNHMSWWQQVGYFLRHFTCVAYAHRGFAPSSPIAGGPDPADYGDDLLALCDALKLDRPRIVGQSMGGWSAVEAGLKRPGYFRAMVLAATTGSIDPKRVGEPERGRLDGWARAADATRAELAKIGVHQAAGARMGREQPALQLLYRQIDEINAGLDKEALRQRLMAARRRAPEELAGVKCPVLMISGDEDIAIPPFAADAIARVVPGVRVAHLREAGHSGYFERAQAFNGLVDDFFMAVERGGAA